MLKYRNIIGLLLISFLVLLTSCSSVAPGYGRKNYNHQKYVNNLSKKIVFIPITKKSTERSNLIYEKQFLSSHQIKKMNISVYKPIYRLGKEDIINIIVWNHPELNNPTNATADFAQLGFLIDNNGKIYYPYIGWIKIAGKTVIEAQQVVSDRLSKYIKEPQVSIKMLNFSSQYVNVIGAVEHPMRIPLGSKRLTLMDALSESGGINKEGNRSLVRLYRGSHKYWLNLRSATSNYFPGNLILKDQDIINVLNKNDLNAYVIGSASVQKKISFDVARISLSDALLRSGGLNLKKANNEYIYVLRWSKRGYPQAYYIDLKSPETMLISNLFLIYPNDVVYVSTHPLAKVNHIFSNLLSASSTAFYTKKLIE